MNPKQKKVNHGQLKTKINSSDMIKFLNGGIERLI